ncbi:MAG: KEOPS complex subunit Cgi121 [Methanobacteriaceae archaeon]|nr:KEOPS complex subunit Cgi121 [Candidatus Methanorudis spinitermitis]
MRNIEDLNLFHSLKIKENIEIAGYKTKIENIRETLETIKNLSDNCCEGCIIQLLDADGIAGKKHLLHGVIHSINAFKRRENLANDFGIEICLRLSAQRQISKALDILGLKKGKMNIGVVFINCPDYFVDELNNLFYRDDNVLKPNNDLKEIYDISEKELDIMSIEDILIDKTTELIVEL